MKAIGITKSLPTSDKNCFIAFETEKPMPEDYDLLVKIHAVSVNPVDYKVRQSAAKDEELDEPKILGWDAAGIVEAVGSEVSNFKVGDEVYYSGEYGRPGCNAEFQLVDSRIAGHKPSNLSFAEAAAMPLTSLTAWEAIFDRLRLQKNGESGKKLLIIGGAGGVGSIAIQIAKKLTNIEVIATASREETSDWCKKLGADVIINHHELIQQMESANISEIDFILNFSDTDMHWDAMAKLIKPQGQICSIVENKDPLDLNKLKNKSASFHWEFMFTRSLFKTEDMIAQHKILEELRLLFEEGTLKSTINKTFEGLDTGVFREVHEFQESGKSIGKNVISYI
ncbi:zinc-binding alcohol dehydrogenase family protein [Zunongwangia sp. HGR-M22]|uniref:zinc-binding alcohol dehydrogenase family protein n=1 Tax=Zunongwangia sp. HGR-M22 TaxID=3015168 RepID=UPI0022DDEA3A|nr:zinc-binding alcohol dehydrogenase family protein [Zunongwangia sp. HGR-M22]WBL24044.1 zinc-binding alcohol dehydrogenase family protein [Zunongwangia sp. HGR-M22]